MRALAIVWIVGCSGKDDDIVPPPTDDTETTPSETGDTGEAPSSPDLVVLPENVYHVSVAWELAVVDIRSAWDVIVSWDGLETDLWGNPVDNSTIPVFALFEVLYPPDQVAEHLAVDDLGSDLLSVWEADVTGDIFSNLSALSSGATPFSPEDFLLVEPSKTWVAALALRDGERLDLRGALAMQGVIGGATAVDVTSDTASVTWSGALDGTPLETSAGHELYTVDWAQITTDALGKEFDTDLGDELFLGRFDGVTPAALAPELATLSRTASVWFTMDVERETDARLDLARDSDNVVFDGFSAGTWIIGVRCGTCLSPFPLWAAVLEVE